MDVRSDHQLPEPSLVDVSLAHETRAVQAESLQPSIEIEPGRRRADEEKPAAFVPASLLREGLEELRDSLARVDVAEAAEEWLAADGGRRQIGDGEGGMRHDPDRPGIRSRARPVVDVARMNDEAGGEIQHLAREVEVLRTVLPERGDALVENRVTEKPADDTALALHRVQVAVPVATTDREARDQVVQDEIVENDDTGRTAQRLDDPTVRVRIVADVVDSRGRCPAVASSSRA